MNTNRIYKINLHDRNFHQPVQNDSQRGVTNISINIYEDFLKKIHI